MDSDTIAFIVVFIWLCTIAVLLKTYLESSN